MTNPMPDKADDGLHIHCTELRGTMSAWSEVKLPCSKCDWGHGVPATPPAITEEAVESAFQAFDPSGKYRGLMEDRHQRPLQRMRAALTAALKTMGKVE